MARYTYSRAAKPGRAAEAHHARGIDGSRTRDLDLGKVALYQLSYYPWRPRQGSDLHL